MCDFPPANVTSANVYTVSTSGERFVNLKSILTIRLNNTEQWEYQLIYLFASTPFIGITIGSVVCFYLFPLPF